MFRLLRTYLNASAPLTAILTFLFGTALFFIDFPLHGAFVIFSAQLIFALYQLYNLDRGFCFQDLRLLFVLVYSLYGCAYPLFVIVSTQNQPAAAVYDVAMAMLLYALGLFGFNTAVWVRPVRWVDFEFDCFRFKYKTWPGQLFLLALITYSIFYAMSHGTQVALTINRSNQGDMYTQSWILLMFIISGVLMYFARFYKYLNRISRFNVVFCSFIFVLFMLMLGNRRDFLPLILFVIAIKSVRQKLRFNWRYFFVLTVLFVFFLAIGFLRYIDNYDSDNPLKSILQSNEFTYPIQTLVHYVHVDELSLYFGQTYFRLPLYFIPRQVWNDKPTSLSVQFLSDAFGTVNYQGFAYTPVTEAFLNFSFVGPFMVMCVFGFIMGFLVKHWNRYPVIYFICLAYIVDFNRGEFSTHLYGLFFVYCGFKISDLLCRHFSHTSSFSSKYRSLTDH